MRKYVSMIILILFVLSGFAGVNVLVGQWRPVLRYNIPDFSPQPRPASFEVIDKYNQGIDLLKEDKKESALRFIQQAAESGYLQAQRQLAWMLYYGIGINADRAQALQWFLKAAEQNDPFSQDRVAAQYYFGDSVEKNLGKAAEWTLKAAENGWIPAFAPLGYHYQNGEGIAKDLKQAVFWYERAFKAGNAEAAYRLALLYRNGEGVRKDELKAEELFGFAAKNGFDPKQNGEQ